MAEIKHTQTDPAAPAISEQVGPTRHEWADYFLVQTGPNGTKVSFGRVRQDGSNVVDLHTAVMLVGDVAQGFIAAVAQMNDQMVAAASPQAHH